MRSLLLRATPRLASLFLVITACGSGTVNTAPDPQSDFAVSPLDDAGGVIPRDMPAAQDALMSVDGPLMSEDLTMSVFDFAGTVADLSMSPPDLTQLPDMATMPPVLSSVTPNMGPPGSLVILGGSKLTGARELTLGGAAVGTFTVDSDQKISAVVPLGAKSGPFRVVTPGGAAQSPNFTVTAPQNVGIFPDSQIVPATPGVTRTFQVRVDPNTAWSAQSQVPWVTTMSTGKGDGVVTYTVAASNQAGPRLGLVQVAGRVFTVHQDGTAQLVHPRLWINPTDVQRLRGWAVPGNPMWKSGFGAALADAIVYADKHWDWNTGKPDTVFRQPYSFDAGVASGWRDDGGSNWQGDATEAYAELFAFASLVHPDPPTRDALAKRARAMLMWVLTGANAQAGKHGTFPFGANNMAGYNRANYWGEAIGLAMDWVYPSLTPKDKEVAQSVFLMWNDDMLTVATAGNEHPQPIGVENDPKLFANSAQLRWAANNYFIGHFRNMALRSLAFDPADDPAVPGRASYPTVRSFIKNVTGAWLYQIWAMFTPAADVSAALGGLQNPSFGLASGGVPVEGSLYGESQGYLSQGLWGLRTTGMDDPALIGPQAQMVSSPYWDRMWQAFAQMQVPKPQLLPGLEYMGPLYQRGNYGDVLLTWLAEDGLNNIAPLGIRRALEGDSDVAQAIRWMAINMLQGGAGHLDQRAHNVWGNSYATTSLLYFMLLDPNAPPAADPRVALPRTFVDDAFGRVVSRTGWDQNASMFVAAMHWTTINHQQGDSGLFELYRKGEWMWKEWSGYANDGFNCTPTYKNALSIQNDVALRHEWYEQPIVDLGGQWMNGSNSGDPVHQVSQGTGWVMFAGDTTKLYNRNDGQAQDVKHASRSLVWLSPDHVVVYDRATTGKANRFKRWNLTVTALPQVTQDGKGRYLATVNTKGGQALYVQHLLPAAATMVEQHKWVGTPNKEFDLVAQGEQASYRLLTEATGGPADVRFLHVLQAGDKGAAQTPLSALRDQGGSTWDIAVVGRTAVAFPIAAGGGANGLTYTVPATVAGHVITGLTPGAAYDVTTTPDRNNMNLTVKVAPGMAQKADAGGSIAIGNVAP